MTNDADPSSAVDTPSPRVLLGMLGDRVVVRHRDQRPVLGLLRHRPHTQEVLVGPLYVLIICIISIPWWLEMRSAFRLWRIARREARMLDDELRVLF